MIYATVPSQFPTTTSLCSAPLWPDGPARPSPPVSVHRLLQEPKRLCQQQTDVGVAAKWPNKDVKRSLQRAARAQNLPQPAPLPFPALPPHGGKRLRDPSAAVSATPLNAPAAVLQLPLLTSGHKNTRFRRDPKTSVKYLSGQTGPSLKIKARRREKKEENWNVPSVQSV